MDSILQYLKRIVDEDGRKRRKMKETPIHLTDEHDGEDTSSYNTCIDRMFDEEDMTHPSHQHQPGCASEPVHHDESIDLNDVFPGAIDQIYEPPPSQLKYRCKTVIGNCTELFIASPNRASFLDLPQELRDEIYHYLLPYNQTRKIRFYPNSKRRNDDLAFHERWLQPVYQALPSYRHEILEVYYRQNTFRLIATHEYSRQKACEWIRTYARYLGQKLPKLIISHAIAVRGMPSYYWSGHVCTTITLRADNTAEATTTYQRSADTCVCELPVLVRQRLAEEDALADPDCVQRIEESTQYGPVLGFGLQLLEAVRLSELQQTILRAMPYKEKLDLQKKVLTHCHMCGGCRWGFQYCAQLVDKVVAR